MTDFGATSDFASAVAIQDDGSIVVAGTSGPLEQRAADVVHRPVHFALARYTTDGRLDPSFGTGGKVLTDVRSQSSDFASSPAITIQGDGKIVAAGGSGDSYGSHYFVLARYNADGSVDTSFGSRGRVVTAFGLESGASAVAIQPGGRIIAAGRSGSSEEVGDFALVRYSPDGRVDTSFGADGKVLTGFRPGREDSSASALAILGDGKIVAAGYSDRGYGGDFALARYTTDGRLDPSFGRRGKVLTDFAPAVTRVASLSAMRTRRGVLLRWRTASEVGTRGFNVYRRTTGRRVRVNRKLVRGRGGASRSAAYSFLDSRPPHSGAARYWVEDIRRDGRRLLWGPARVRR